MAVHCLRYEQHIHAPLSEVWSFFSNPKNLATITPEYMAFQVTSTFLPERIYPGQVITYKVRPVLGIPLFWMTEITHVSDGSFFVDEQRVGPYRIWHHEHHFQETGGGVLMTDIVHYQLPMSILGEVAHLLFVRRQLADIFKFRFDKVNHLFRNPSVNL